MNLYLIHQSANADYDTYDSAVVCAPDEATAKRIHPGGYDDPVPEGGDTCDEQYGTWTQQANVKVELIGVAAESVKEGVVIASFNAG